MLPRPLGVKNYLSTTPRALRWTAYTEAAGCPYTRDAEDPHSFDSAASPAQPPHRAPDTSHDASNRRTYDDRDAEAKMQAGMLRPKQVHCAVHKVFAMMLSPSESETH